MSDVGWGRIDRARLDDLMEMNTRYHDFILRTPLPPSRLRDHSPSRSATILSRVHKERRVIGLLIFRRTMPISPGSEACCGWTGS